MRLAIFGAKSIALGVCRAVQVLYSDFEIAGFLVSTRTGNPDTLAGLPVFEVRNFTEKNICILVATPEDVQEDIVQNLETLGFHNHVCIDAEKESALMEKYYIRLGIFKTL